MNIFMNNVIKNKYIIKTVPKSESGLKKEKENLACLIIVVITSYHK